jgi:thiol-disulfide isomerase/thioredoxin
MKLAYSRLHSRWLPQLALLLAVALASDTIPAALAANPQVADALKLKPVQPGVDYVRPTAADAQQSSFTAETIPDGVGWFLRSAQGQLMRRFVDTNMDKKVDLWCYYKDGVEVYRDIDSDFDGLADNYRWLGTAGTRWGVDRNGDQRIDSWKIISAAEVSQELVEALRTASPERFNALLVSDVDLQQLGITGPLATQLSKLGSESRSGFAALAEKQTMIQQATRWTHFGAGVPGLLPAGTNGIQNDLIVLDSAAAVVETGDQHQQLLLGSLVQVGKCWKLIDMPRHLAGAELAASSGFFFQSTIEAGASGSQNVPMGLGEEEQMLMVQLETIDRQLAAATTSQQKMALNERRADQMEQLSRLAKSQEQKSIWIRQLADIVSAAAQSGEYPGGVQRLQKIAQQLSQKPSDPDLAYVTIRAMSASYGRSLQAPDADYEKIQRTWIEDLEGFISRHPTSPDTSEAILQLAISLEFSAEPAQALAWYQQIITKFSKTPVAEKSAGAVRRLQSKGKPLVISGTTLDGTPMSLAAMRDKHRAVVVHYWASWCGPCKQEMAALKQLQAEMGPELGLLGVNLDSDPAAAREVVRGMGANWSQLYEKGAMESRLANEMGIITLPTMLLLDRQGNVVEHGIHVSRLQDAIRNLR